uniref:NFATC2-interacting protein n=1 Tax=Chelydra serpentina TaxID=8475 RepID=A0A8C3SE30_CHESE
LKPLHRLMERYQEAMGLGGRQLRFFFDGQRLAGTRTPEQLGMEPDDVIEAWAYAPTPPRGAPRAAGHGAR